MESPTFTDSSADVKAQEAQRMEIQLRRMNVENLKKMCRQKKIKGFSSKNKQWLASTLLDKFKATGDFGNSDGGDEDSDGWPIPGSNREHFFMKCMGSWFMTKPAKKEWMNSLQVGLEAEPETIKNFPLFLGAYTDYEVVNQTELGLVSPETAKYLATSVDNILVLKKKGELLSILNLIVAVVEAKAKTNENVRKKEMKMMESRKIRPFEVLKLSSGEASRKETSAAFLRSVHLKSHRVQVCIV